MGATGRTGGEVARACEAADMEVRAAVRKTEAWSGPGEPVRFDLLDAATFPEALEGCETLFVMRPPPVTDAETWPPLFAAAAEAGIRHVVVSSVKGADRNRFLPHRHMEDAARASGIPTAVLRPSDYMQNLETVHREAVRRGELPLPAGRGRSSLIDVRDIGRCAAAVFENEQTGEWALTGPEALNWHEVCATLSEVLGYPVRYHSANPALFLLRRWRQGHPLGISAVMTALYTVQRLGLAAEVTDGVRTLTGKPPTPFRTYAEREREVWLPPFEGSA